MFGKNRNQKDDGQRYSRSENAGYDNRFGSYGMRGPQRQATNEVDAYVGSRGNQMGNDRSEMSRSQGYSDYSAFEGTSDRPYYGGEEGRFPYGGNTFEDHSDPLHSSAEIRGSWNADERNYGGKWMSENQSQSNHIGKGPKGYRRSDARVHEEICEILTDHHEVDASEIEVSVQDGIVTLAGSVEDRQTKRFVEDLIDRVNGVDDIRNELRVAARGISPQNVSDFHSFTGSREQDDQSMPDSSMNSSQRSKSLDSSERSSKSGKNAQSSQRR